MIRYTSTASNMPRKLVPQETLLATRFKEAFERQKARRRRTEPAD